MRWKRIQHREIDTASVWIQYKPMDYAVANSGGGTNEEVKSKTDDFVGFGAQ